MSDVPLVRKRLQDLAERLKGTDPAAARELLSLIPLLRREPPAKPRAAQTSDPMTPDKAERIRAQAAANPRKPNHEIARAFNVNPGRVSEALRKKRRKRAS